MHSSNFSASPVFQHLLLLFCQKTKTGRLLTLDNCGCIKNPHRIAPNRVTSSNPGSCRTRNFCCCLYWGREKLIHYGLFHFLIMFSRCCVIYRLYVVVWQSFYLLTLWRRTHSCCNVPWNSRALNKQVRHNLSFGDNISIIVISQYQLHVFFYVNVWVQHNVHWVQIQIKPKSYFWRRWRHYRIICTHVFMSVYSCRGASGCRSGVGWRFLLSWVGSKLLQVWNRVEISPVGLKLRPSRRNVNLLDLVEPI